MRRLMLFSGLLFAFAITGLMSGGSPDHVTASTDATAVPTQAVTAAVSLPTTLDLKGVISPVHDPTLVKDGSLYYVIATGQGIPIHCSPDMINWDTCGNVFKVYPYWVYQTIPAVTDLWAPDLVRWDGKFHLYYAASSFGSNLSAIGLATNTTLDQSSKAYKWVDEGLVIASHPGDDFNAIDPNLVTDQTGQRWLVFGSFWTGIKMRKIGSSTGKLDTTDSTLYALASRPGITAIEGAYITYHAGYYYLFVSFDHCCQGVNSNYKIMIGRSDTIIGPYVDKTNTPMMTGGGSLVYAGSDRWRGPGHNSIYIENGIYYMVYHSYDARANGVPTLRIDALQWDSDGWPYIVDTQ